jgi:hypothetical protein
MDSRPWQVEGLVQGDEGFKIGGIILGNDFDLSVRKRDGEIRQITIGERSWTSADQGKTWKQDASTDRRYFFLVRAPIRFKADDKIPPFESVGKSREGDEDLLHIRFKAPDKVAYEGDRPNHWLTLEEGKPIGVRRYAGPLVFNNDYVTAQVRYSSVDNPKPIMPPPGNPAAVPQVDPGSAALNKACEAMQSGLWEVKATVSAGKSMMVSGLIEGEDFDLTMTPVDGGQPLRQIAIKDKAWITKDGGKTWKSTGSDDRLLYRWVRSPILPSSNLPTFEIVGKEKRAQDSLLHVRLKVSEKLGSEKERPHYWLGLREEDRVESVRRYEGDLATTDGQVIRCEADYQPAQVNAAIAPPDSKRIKAQTASMLPAPSGKKPMGFFALDEQKAKLDGQIVPVEITGQVIQSQEVGTGQFRLMVKDTDKRYGLIDISREGIEKLGLTGKGASRPLTLYMRITNLGAKPAPRATAVGTKFIPANEKEGTYTWE